MKIEEFKKLSILLEKEIIKEKEIEYKESRRKKKEEGGRREEERRGQRGSGSKIIFCALLYEELSNL